MFRLRQLERTRRRIEKLYQPDIAKAEEGKHPWIAVSGVLAKRDIDLGPVEDEINAEKSRRITREAEKLDLEIPPFSNESEYWERARYGDFIFLSGKGRQFLRELIQEQKSRRFEVKVRWIKLLMLLITAIAGLIGVITGLVSVLRK